MKNTFLYITLAVLFTIPVIGLAQNTDGSITYTPLEPIPGYEEYQTGQNFGLFLQGAFTLALAAGAIFAVGALVYSGISYMVSEVANTKEDAKRRIRAAVFGLLILLGSWLILNTINPDLLKFNFVVTKEALGDPGAGAPNTTTQKKSSSGPSQDAIDTCQQEKGKLKATKVGGQTVWGCIK